MFSFLFLLINISFFIFILWLIPVATVFIYSIPYYFYCSGVLDKQAYSKLPTVNFIKLFFLSTKCYLYWLTFRKPKNLTTVFALETK